jgi:hypothetical protein
VSLFIDLDPTLSFHAIDQDTLVHSFFSFQVMEPGFGVIPNVRYIQRPGQLIGGQKMRDHFFGQNDQSLTFKPFLFAESGSHGL